MNYANDNNDYINEIRLIKSTFFRCRVECNVYTKKDYEQGKNQNKETFYQIAISDLLSVLFTELNNNTLFRVTDKYGLNYLSLLLPCELEQSILLIGPFSHKPLLPKDVLQVSESNNLSPKYKNLLQENLSLVPIIDPESHLFTLLHAFCEQLFGEHYEVKTITQQKLAPIKDLNSLLEQHNAELTKSSMHVIKQKYDFENKVLQTVELGQIHRLRTLFSSFTESAFKKRLPDFLREVKNYCIIANTLLRKSAERGGVHPYYLDATSSTFAVRIESIHSSKEGIELLKEMFFAYCQLVCDYFIKDYSPVVAGSVTYVMNNLQEQLSLSVVAKEQNVSKEYLSAVFKRETGKTITQFITEKRMQLAITLLTTTKLKIETISQHCGILDLQYFCKLFKKTTGKSPKQFR